LFVIEDAIFGLEDHYMLLWVLFFLSDTDYKVAYCVTCEVSIGNSLQAAVHYRSREHINCRLQRGLPVSQLPPCEDDQSSANRDFINECLRRGIGLQQPDIPQPRLLHW